MAWRPSNIIKEEEEKKEGKRRGEEKIQDGLVVVEVMMENFPLVPFPFVSFPFCSCLEVLFTKKKF